VFALNHFEAPNAAADIDADTLSVLLCDEQPRTRKSVVRGRYTHLDKAPHLFDVFLLDETRRIEVLDLAGDLAVERRRIKRLNARYTVAAFEERFPCALRRVANRTQQTNAGDYYSAGNRCISFSCDLRRIMRDSRPGERGPTDPCIRIATPR
jgi:hypothetical protein